MPFQSQKKRKLPPRKVLNEHEQISNPSLNYSRFVW
jgi:hypothetical protein